MKNIAGYLLICMFVLSTTELFWAAQQKEAHVTQVIRDVRLLAHNSASRSAALNDTVVGGNAVRTGGDSRAELTFTDQTLTRIGANSVFSFGAGATEFDLASGAMLLSVPKSAGTVRVNTAAVSAAISGFTFLCESHKNSWSKFILLDGNACLRKKTAPNEPCITLHGGDMVLYRNGRFSDVKHIDVSKLMRTSNLLTEFPHLPRWAFDPIEDVINDQQGGGHPPGYYTDPTGHDAVYEKISSEPTVTPGPTVRPPHSPPPRGTR